MSESIEDKVRELIVQNFSDISVEDLKDEALFVDDLKADSLAVVEFVLALEQEFDIEIPDEDAEKIRTVGDAIGYIKKNVDA